MTGYGRSTLEQNERYYTVEIKSVNHKYSDITIYQLIYKQHRIIYSIYNNKIYIISVLHTAQSPDPLRQWAQDSGAPRKPVRCCSFGPHNPKDKRPPEYRSTGIL